MAVLKLADVAEKLKSLDGWTLSGKTIRKEFVFQDFPEAVLFVSALVPGAEDADHHPDIEIHYKKVVLVYSTHSEGGITEYDLTLAARISLLAHELGAGPEAGPLQKVEIAIDCMDPNAIRDFWRAGLDLEETSVPGEGTALTDPAGVQPELWFQQMTEPRTDRNRIHIDVYVPEEEAQKRVEEVLAAGGILVTDKHAPSWWVLADAEGNELCVCV